MPFRKADVQAAIAHLQKVDDVLGRFILRAGPFTLKTHRDRFGLLVRSILSQQISTKAARSIRLRLEDSLQETGVTPEAILSTDDTVLRGVGLSSQKVKYLRDLSQRVVDGSLALPKIHRFSDEEAIEQLIEVKGIGRWTAQMFLIFSLGRLNIFPPDDLGIRAALKKLYQLPDLPDKKTCLKIAEPWSPYATIATWYVWRVSDMESDPEADASQYPV